LGADSIREIGGLKRLGGFMPLVENKSGLDETGDIYRGGA